MTTRRLRIMHNGHVFQNNPHWHFWINNDGNLRGEIIGHRSDFKAVQHFERQLNESDAITLFTEAEAMRPHFKQREVACQPDDVMIEFTEDAEGAITTLFWFVIPLEKQQSPEASVFLRIVNQILEPYV